MTPAGRFVPDGADPGRPLPRRASPTGRRRSATACTSRTTWAATPSPPGRTRIRPGTRCTVINPNTGRITATIDLGTAGDPFGVAFNRAATKAYVTNWTGRSVSVIDTAAAARRADDPALAGRRPAPGRSPDGDRRQPDERRDLHRERLERHGERDRLAPRPARGHDRRRARPGRAEGVDARGAGGQPRRPDALRRRRGRERRGGRRPPAPATSAGSSRRPGIRPTSRSTPDGHRLVVVEHERLRRGPEPVRAVLAAPGPGLRHGHRVLAGLLREPVQRHDDPRVGAGDRPARRPRVRPPAAAAGRRQVRRNNHVAERRARPARGGERDPPRDLRDQGEPHLRPGLRRPGEGQRRPVT